MLILTTLYKYNYNSINLIFKKLLLLLFITIIINSNIQIVIYKLYLFYTKFTLFLTLNFNILLTSFTLPFFPLFLMFFLTYYF